MKTSRILSGTVISLFFLGLFVFFYYKYKQKIDPNSPANIASRYAVLTGQHRYQEASILATESEAWRLNWNAKQDAKQSPQVVIDKIWKNMKATPKKQYMEDKYLNIEIVIQGTYRGTPHWCLNTVYLEQIQDEWKVANNTTKKCGVNIEPPK